MSEIFQGQEALMTVQEVLESMTPLQLLELKRAHLAKRREINESLVEIDKVMEGYGCVVEVLDETRD